MALKCRGSLYRLLHKPGAKEMLDERRRLNMAYDVVRIQRLAFVVLQFIYSSVFSFRSSLLLFSVVIISNCVLILLG